jgi:hypothetical protein
MTARTFRPTLEALEDRCVPSTLKVTNTADSGPGSLRDEIAQATSVDKIVFSNKLDGQTITLTSGELVISKNLSINGDGRLTITSQPYEDMALELLNGSRIFEVDGANTTVKISGLKLTGGGGTRFGGGVTGYPYDGYGGVVLNFGTLTLSGCTLGGTLNSNYAQVGGAIANFGTMTVKDCAVSGNFTTSGVGLSDVGGGIYNAGTLTVSGGDVSGNSAGSGGGIYNQNRLTVSGCTLSGDSAGSGGGIFNAGTQSGLMVSNSTFSGNSPDNISGPYTDGGGNAFH